MKHKNFKNKILSAILHNNPNNYGVSLEAIIENIPFFSIYREDSKCYMR